jgi:dihydropyrimidinase
MTLERWVEACSTRATQIFWTDPRKGSIALGQDADLVFWNADTPFEIAPDQLQTVTDWTPFEGWKGKGKAHTVLVRGQIVVKEGRFLGKAAQGEFLHGGGSSAVAKHAEKVRG